MSDTKALDEAHPDPRDPDPIERSYRLPQASAADMCRIGRGELWPGWWWGAPPPDAQRND